MFHILGFLLITHGLFLPTGSLPSNCIAVVSHEEIRVHCVDPVGIPPGLPEKTTHLILSCKEEEEDLAQDTIDRIPTNAFKQTPLIRRLDLIGCPISYIEEEAFNDLGNLRTLIIANAKIEQLSSGQFSKNPFLEEIHIFNCPHLSNIGQNLLTSTNIFRKISLENTSVPVSEILNTLTPAIKCLREVAIRHHRLPIDAGDISLINKIDKFKLNSADLTDSIVENLELLRHVETKKLNLSGSRSRQKSSLDITTLMPDTLVTLDMSRTGLDHLQFSETRTGFRRMPKLKELILKSNKIDTLPWKYINEMHYWTPEIETLDLSENRITTLPKELASKPQAMVRMEKINLRLEGNPIHCNCELSWLNDVDNESSVGKVVESMKNMLQCFTCAIRTEETNYTQIVWEQGFADLFKQLDKIKLACLPPARPKLSLRSLTSLNRSQTSKKPMYKLRTGGSRRLVVVCMSSGDPPPEIVWTDINTGEVHGRNRVSKLRGPTANIYPASLIIDEAFVRQKQRRNVFMSCAAENSAGQSRSEVRITIDGQLAVFLQDKGEGKLSINETDMNSEGEFLQLTDENSAMAPRHNILYLLLLCISYYTILSASV